MKHELLNEYEIIGSLALIMLAVSVLLDLINDVKSVLSKEN